MPISQKLCFVKHLIAVETLARELIEPMFAINDSKGLKCSVTLGAGFRPQPFQPVPCEVRCAGRDASATMKVAGMVVDVEERRGRVSGQPIVFGRGSGTWLESCKTNRKRVT